MNDVSEKMMTYFLVLEDFIKIVSLFSYQPDYFFVYFRTKFHAADDFMQLLNNKVWSFEIFFNSLTSESVAQVSQLGVLVMWAGYTNLGDYWTVGCHQSDYFFILAVCLCEIKQKLQVEYSFVLDC